MIGSGGHSPHEGISLIKEAQRPALYLLPCVEMVRRHHLKENRSSPDIISTDTMIFDFTGSRTVRSFIFCKMPGLWYFMQLE